MVIAEQTTSANPIIVTEKRPRVGGKFLFVGDEKLYVRGVTYGTFRPGPGGGAFPDEATVAADFALMAAKGEDPEGLVTYVNFPTTEYLQLPMLDLVCFNVYLEAQTPFAAYIARLQTVAGERPLLITEIGLDSRRNGLREQARSLGWQL